jgi:hypothetical protein
MYEWYTGHALQTEALGHPQSKVVVHSVVGVIG